MIFCKLTYQDTPQALDKLAEFLAKWLATNPVPEFKLASRTNPEDPEPVIIYKYGADEAA